MRAAACAKTFLPIQQTMIQGTAFLLVGDAEIKKTLVLVLLDQRTEQVSLRANLSSFFRDRTILCMRHGRSFVNGCARNNFIAAIGRELFDLFRKT